MKNTLQLQNMTLKTNVKHLFGVRFYFKETLFLNTLTWWQSYCLNISPKTFKKFKFKQKFGF